MNREPLIHPLRFLFEHRLACHHASEFVDGELDPKAAARIEHHARFCPRCHDLIASLRRTIAAMGRLRDEPVPAGAEPSTDAIIARLREEP